MARERAFQQLDPLGALGSRPLTLLAAAVIPVYACGMTFLNRFDVDYPLLAVVALWLAIVTSVALIYGSSPLRAPFTQLMHFVVIISATGAHVANAASMWESNAYVRDDWGPVAIGVAYLAMARFRPPRELAASGLILALFCGVLALVQAPSFVSPVPPILLALVSMTPILTMALAAAAFGQYLIEGLERWRRHAGRAATSFAAVNSDWIARSVQQDRVTILNQEIVPFFSAVLHKDAINADDRQRARQIADAIRAIMVAEVGRSWLDAILHQLEGRPANDPARLAAQMTTDQRGAVRATVLALTGLASYQTGSLDVTVSRRGASGDVLVSATFSSADNVVRGEMAPFLAVLRIVFADFNVDLSGPRLALRFSYELG